MNSLPIKDLVYGVVFSWTVGIMMRSTQVQRIATEGSHPLADKRSEETIISLVTFVPADSLHCAGSPGCSRRSNDVGQGFWEGGRARTSISVDDTEHGKLFNAHTKSPTKYPRPTRVPVVYEVFAVPLPWAARIFSPLVMGDCT